MSLMPSTIGGHYDANGQWVQTKRCFVYCGPERCDCQPPMGRHYSPRHDSQLPLPISGDAQLQAVQSNPELLSKLKHCPWDAWKAERSL